MSAIKILSESLANQIAAGEVVERPASVVKELLENALDAGAAHVSVEIEGAGTRLIRVIDDGCGMDQDDLLLCLERHATSKLTSVEQLAAIMTLGFRGEALPSIASVSKMVITSRINEAALGNQVDIRFGTIKKMHEMGCAKGVIMEVRDLFGNVPARRKFLKSPQTEIAHIEEVVRAYGLANHGLGLSYQVDGKSILELAPAEASENRVRHILGSDLDYIVLQKSASLREGCTFHLDGFLIPPDQAVGKAARLWLFVNGRSVKDRMVNHAVLEGLQDFMMKGRKAAGVLYLTLPADALDVNVHPTKQEVRFRDSGFIHTLVAAAVQQGMAAFQDQLKFAVFGHPEKKGSPASDDAPARLKRREFFDVRRDIFHAEVQAPAELQPRSVPGPSDLTCSEACAQTAPHGEEDQVASGPTFSGKTAEPAAPYLAVDQSGQQADSQALAAPSSLRYIGQLLDTYILCEGEDGMVVIDQHAAQERLIFEELKLQYLRKDVPSQVLLFPQLMECSRAQIQVLEQFADEIAQLGLEIEDFGGESFVVKAVPATLAHLPPLEVVESICDRFAAEEIAGQGVARLEHVLAGMACKASIKAGRRLSGKEAEHLLAQMQSAGIFSHCPHGRPVVRHFCRHDLQKWFYRS